MFTFNKGKHLMFVYTSAQSNTYDFEQLPYTLFKSDDHNDINQALWMSCGMSGGRWSCYSREKSLLQSDTYSE